MLIQQATQCIEYREVELKMSKRSATLLSVAGVLVIASNFPTPFYKRNALTEATPIGIDGAYLLCRKKILEKSLNPDLAKVPEVEGVASEDEHVHFSWDASSAHVGLPTFLGKVYPYDVRCVVDKSTGAVTHLTMKKHRN